MATTAGDENHLFIEAELEGNTTETRKKNLSLYDVTTYVVNERETRRGVMKRACRNFDSASRGTRSNKFQKMFHEYKMCHFEHKFQSTCEDASRTHQAFLRSNIVSADKPR